MGRGTGSGVLAAALVMIALASSGCIRTPASLAPATASTPAPTPISDQAATSIAEKFLGADVSPDALFVGSLWGWPARSFYASATGDTITIDLVTGTVGSVSFGKPEPVLGDTGPEPIALAEQFARENDLFVPDVEPECDVEDVEGAVYLVSWGERREGVQLPRVLTVRVLRDQRAVSYFFNIRHGTPRSLEPLISRADAIRAARVPEGDRAGTRLCVYPIALRPRLLWSVSSEGFEPLTEGPGGQSIGIARAVTVFVDARSGAIVRPQFGSDAETGGNRGSAAGALEAAGAPLDSEAAE